jgi:hypothetical protein
MVVVKRWTVGKVALLQEALDLSNSEFADGAKFSERQVREWKVPGREVQLRPSSRRALNAYLHKMEIEHPDAIREFERLIHKTPSIDERPNCVDRPEDLAGRGEVPYGQGNTAEVSWVDRPDFIRLIAATVTGAALAPDVGRLAALLPRRAEPVSRLRIGAADVDAIAAVTDGFRRSAYSRGGGLVRAAAVAHLQQVKALKDAECTQAVRTRLRVTTAELGEQVGWLAFDVEDHDEARKTWAYALAVAEQSNSPDGNDLLVHTLCDLATQSLHLARRATKPKDVAARLDEALSFAKLANVKAVSGPFPVAQVTEGFASAVLAQCQASRGDADSTRRALGRAEDAYALVDDSTVTPWTRFLTSAAAHEADKGDSLYLLSLKHPESDYASGAVAHLSAAVDGWGSDQDRCKAIDMPRLAAARFVLGDIENAVATGHEAITAGSGLSSRRVATRLQELDSVAARYSASPDVADLRGRISEVLAVAV